MAQAQKARDTEAWAFKPEEIMPQQRLRRALAEPDVLDAFLADPKEVAKRYNVSLTDHEITTVHNASHFLASWDVFCGDSQWLDSARFDGRTISAGPSLSDAVVDGVRRRITQEILQEMPRAIRRVVSEVGADALVDPEVRLDDLSENIQPLARSLRQVIRTMTRELRREFTASPSIYRAFGQPAEISGYSLPVSAIQRVVASGYGTTPSPANGDGITALGQILGQHLNEVVNHAAQEAIEHLRPQQVQPQPRRRPATFQAEPIADLQ